MKFPSVKNLFQSAGRTVERFPFESLFALAGTIAATVKIELTYTSRVQENWSLRTILVANLGLLLSLSATLFTESKTITGSKKLLIRAVAAIVALLLLFVINPGEHEADYIRFVLFSLSLHLAVAYAAFTDKGHIQGFWQFNKTLFLRFLTGALYGIVLFAGLAAAIGAMNFLFNFKFEWDTFSILFTWIAGIFSTLFFLSGVPDDFVGLDTDDSYPKGLKVFTQYVLIPLATVYVVILLAYEVKILVQWQLPKGLVSNLILGYAVFGILSLLLVYPIREKEENKWLKTYTRYFYFFLIPLLALLFAAAGTRVFRYGITEMRYFLLMLAVWLLFINLYFLIAKKQSIKLIPISLSLFILLSVYGPQSAFSVAMYSQRRILVETFKKHNAFKDGKLMAIDSTKISRKDGSKIVADLSYLIYKHGLQSLQPYFNQDLDKVSDSLAIHKDKLDAMDNTNYGVRYAKLEWTKKQLGLNKFSEYYNGEDEPYNPDPLKIHSYARDNTKVTVIKGFDYIINENRVYSDTSKFKIDGIECKQSVSDQALYSLQIGNTTAYFNVHKVAEKILKIKELKTTPDPNRPVVLSDSLLTLTQEIKGYTVILKINQLNFSTNNRDFDIDYIDANYLVKKQ
ncbi:DUF4153 domain-containing protein [Mucilaginibacter sp. ZT4R22]|uniref:DUF4153 domain-containing protein n=1 Tax=Mucilaginibacter pankratovii TaxID=2772110 RepID=A0ABR7WYZ9_9SPHI|nr:DUF4153 domain-containing protein [Mucilaginibacter pankratovii]MBD1367509.1 DUF4153 domain-containing protein [Mucilaginibacter pankratovii]